MSITTDDTERITQWALRQLGVTDDRRDQLIDDDTCQQLAVLYRHAHSVREETTASAPQRIQLTNTMYAARLALSRYVNEQDEADDNEADA